MNFFKQYIYFGLKSHWLLILIVIGAGLRLFDLNWDGVFNFHPDEMNIAGAINHLRASNFFNPDFFAYGSFPIYTNYAVKNLLGSFGFIPSEYLIGRTMSSIASIGCILLVYKIGLILTSKWPERDRKIVLVVATFLTTFSPALIQSAHFMTFETLLAFEYLVFLYFILKADHNQKKLFLYLAAAVIAVAIATKVTSLFLIPILIIAIYRKASLEDNFFRKLKQFGKIIFNATLISFLTLVILFPYIFISWNKFIATINYESMVANGSIKVFYTREFLDTVPLFFQLSKQSNFLFGNLAWLIFLGIGVFYLFIKKNKNKISWIFLLLIILLGLLTQCFLFVKWLRYSVTFIPLCSLFAGLGCLYATKIFKIPSMVIIILLFFLTLSGSILFMNVYIQNDTRIAAANWAEKNIDSDSNILSETYDLGILPFNLKFMKNITLFNFYELDRSKKVKELSTLLEKSDYFISPSRRISANYKNNQIDLPEVYNFYQSLNDGNLGFDLIKVFQTRTDYYLLGYKPEDLEGTFEAFDHPTVKIYKKTKSFKADEYEKIIQK